ncbi:MAG: hypothetical protein PF444_00795 [Bacteroidales bacterium]|jgi:hypothetical protein|nr:hypothetical protein [Bacteroidales bacterium]
MKAIKFLISFILLAFGLSLFAQEVVIDENFQSFEKQGFRNDTVPCKKLKMHSKANFKVEKTYGKSEVEYKFMRAAVTPDCESKKTPMNLGVTKGYVEVNKNNGVFIIGEIDYISTLRVSASATGDVRGYAIYKSVDGGDWVKVGEYIGSKAEGADSQYGFSNKITINEKDVSLKFVPTMCGKDEQALQTVRIHDIKVYGK